MKDKDFKLISIFYHHNIEIMMNPTTYDIIINATNTKKIATIIILNQFMKATPFLRNKNIYISSNAKNGHLKVINWKIKFFLSSNEISLRYNLIVCHSARFIGDLNSRQVGMKFFERAGRIRDGKAFIALHETIFQRIGDALA